MKLIVQSIGDHWYEVVGHPTMRAGVRMYSRGHWGYYFRNLSDNSCAMGMQHGEEHHASSKADALQKIIKAWNGGTL